MRAHKQLTGAIRIDLNHLDKLGPGSFAPRGSQPPTRSLPLLAAHPGGVTPL